MTLKIFAALVASAALLGVPALSAPRHDNAPPPSNTVQQRPPPPASPPPHPFGAAAARRAQVLGQQDFARPPGPYHPPAPTPAQMGYRRGLGDVPAASRRLGPLPQSPARLRSPGHSPYWVHAGSTGPTSGGRAAQGGPRNSGARRPAPVTLSPSRGQAVGSHSRQAPGQDANQWRQQHHFVEHNPPGGTALSQSGYGRPGQNPGYDHGRTQRYPERPFNHRDAHHFWERAWEHDYHANRRYLWQPYIRPHGWYAQQWRFGMYLPYQFWTHNYWISNYWSFGLPQPPYGYIWVREGNSALLINEQDGYILQVIYNIFY